MRSVAISHSGAGGDSPSHPQCNWSNEDARRPLTRDHERALKNQNAILRAEVERLGREVAALRLQVHHGHCSTSDTGTLAEGKSEAGDFSPSPGASGPQPPLPVSASREDGKATSTSGASLSPPPSVFRQQQNQKQPPQQAGLAQIGSGNWGNLPVDDLGGDANGFGRGVSDSEGVDGNSEAESDSEDESGTVDSDEDLDQALAGPTKTLFVCLILFSS